MPLDLPDVLDNLKFTHIDKSPIHGNGLFASQPIAAGIVLGQLDGQVVPWLLHQKYRLAFEWNALDEATLLVRPYRTKYSFINHARQPNLMLRGWPLQVVARHDIAEGAELTLDYRDEPLPPEYIKSEGAFYL